MFIRKKKMKSGAVRAYEVTQVWDPEKKQPRQISKYLGTVATDGEILPKGTLARGRPKKKSPTPDAREQLIVDFGDGFFVSESIKHSAIYEPLGDFFKAKPALLALMAYRLCWPGPMYNCDTWLSGNILGRQMDITQLSSQAISRLLMKLGDEGLQRQFFTRYLESGGEGDKNVIIDATSLPNQIQSDLNAWGYSDGSIDKQFRFHCVVNQQTKRPLFYRNVAGNVSDIGALKATVDELKALGIKQSFALIDAGYCSAKNLAVLRKEKIDFLTRLPAGRSLYKAMVLAYADTMESTYHLVRVGKRTLFVRAIAVDDLYGEKGHLYIILDPERKNKDIQALGSRGFADDKTRLEDSEQHMYDLKSAGLFMLISSKNIPIDEVLQAYYTRQSIEQIFGFSKSILDIVPIRHHSDATVKGYLFLQFLLLIVYIEIREKLQGRFTVEQALLTLKILKCKIYDNDTFILQEVTKKQKEIFALGSILASVGWATRPNN